MRPRGQNAAHAFNAHQPDTNVFPRVQRKHGPLSSRRAEAFPHRVAPSTHKRATKMLIFLQNCIDSRQIVVGAVMRGRLR